VRRRARRVSVSRPKLENVVKPPRTPTNTNVLIVVDMCNRPDAISPANVPITRQPTTFTNAVA
jgi:hypothetical protein